MSLLLGMLAAFALPQQPELLTREQAFALRDALFIEGLSPAEFRPGPTRLPLSPFIAKLREEPILELLKLERDLDSIEQKPLERVRKLFTSLPDPPLVRGATVAIQIPDEVPPSLRSPIIRIVRGVLTAQEELRGALEKLTPEERRTLIEGLPRLAVHPSLKTLDFVRQPMAASEELASLLDKVDIHRIRYAAERLYAEVEEALPDLVSGGPPSFQTKLRFSVEGVSIVLAGFANDEHDERDAMVTIDLGGNDHYTGRHGAGIGYTSLFLDLGGNDRYDLPDVSLGAGLLGIGLAWELGGRDRVSAKSICLGSGVAGVGVFNSSKAGDGEFKSETMSQGFGFQGTGIFLKAGGADLHRTEFLSQGAGMDKGIGILFDPTGPDTLQSKGLGFSLESDLIPRSRSQGFGWGGIGILRSSRDGADHSSASEAQGCGLNGGLGLLVGADGSTYRFEGHGQGFGANAGVGALLRGREFLSRGGAAQGVGVESGVGLILGSPADDLYASAGGKPGGGTYGGLGVLLDFGGSDRYSMAAESAGDDPATAGLGLLLDLGGPNWVSAQSPVTSLRQAGLLTIVAEMESRAESSAVEPVPNLSGRVLSVAQVSAAAREASGQAAYANRVQRLQARKNLEASPGAVVQWIAQHPQPLTRIEAALLGSVLRSPPDGVKAELKNLATAASVQPARNALLVIGQAGLAEAKDQVLEALKREDVASEAARVALDLQLKEAVPDLMILSGFGPPEARASAAIALAALGGRETSATAQALLGSPDPLVRAAAVSLIGKLAAGSLEGLKALASGPNEIPARAAMRALGAIGSGEALQFLAGKLNDPKPGIRIEALRSLAGRTPREHFAAFNARRQDQDARVRLAAMGLDPGR